jgi:hypothetical protein
MLCEVVRVSSGNIILRALMLCKIGSAKVRQIVLSLLMQDVVVFSELEQVLPRLLEVSNVGA